MKDRLLDGGNAMEIGIAVFAAAVLVAVVARILGRVMTGMSRTQGHSQKPPAPGNVPDERHQNVSAVSAR